MAKKKLINKNNKNKKSRFDVNRKETKSRERWSRTIPLYMRGGTRNLNSESC